MTFPTCNDDDDIIYMAFLVESHKNKGATIEELADIVTEKHPELFDE